ncbi:MAG: hypothetical protein AMXMBFR56_53230 [Polyangiaceae bacterium]
MLFGFVALACAGGRPPEAEPSQPRRAATAPRPAPRWARFDEVAAWAPANPEPFASRGHGASAYLIDVRVSPAAREAYLALRPDQSLPSGTLVAAFHKDAKTGRPGPIYVMERQGSGWKYSAFEASGRTAEHGVLTLCERCHAESPTGGLFGLPR